MAVAAKTWTAAYGRYVRLRITAQEVEVDTPNNRSKVRVTGQVYYDGGATAHNAYPQTYTVTVNGVQAGRQTGFTYSLSSGGSKNLTTYTSGWINHNSNGAKSVTVRGHITDGAGDTGTINQTYALTTIARASTLSSFSMPNSLKPGTTTTFNLGISRKSTSFTHDIQLRDGSTVIASWTGQATPTTRSLTATQTNTLLKRMSSSTSRTMTLRVQTKSGSTNIGGALTRTATVRVSSTVKPTVEKLSVTIEGNTHAKNNVKRFVQNISRVSGKFTRNATGGASIRSSKLEIRRYGSLDLQTINSNSGTFPRAVAYSGQYQARGTATDSRGRSSTTDWVDLSNFNVLAYSVPQITIFNTDRRTGTETTVDIKRHGRHSGLSGNNILTIRLQQRPSGATTWTNVAPDVTTPQNGFGTTVTSTGHSIASSYEFRLYIVDQFGNSAEQISTVSTQRVVLDVHKNEGVGIGKIHEQGVLDVDGAAYFKGDLYVNGVKASNSQNLTDITPSSQITDTFAYWQSLPQGTYAVPHTNTIPNQPSSAGIIINTSPNVTVLWYSQPTGTVFRKSGSAEGNISDWTPVDRPRSGSNENGTWIRFNDGTQVCWQNNFSNSSPINNNLGAGLYRSASQIWTFPQQFWGGDVVVTTAAGSWERWTTVFDITQSTVRIIEITPGTGQTTTRQRLMAVGRWKSQRDN